jgi:hypothetical protein
VNPPPLSLTTKPPRQLVAGSFAGVVRAGFPLGSETDGFSWQQQVEQPLLGQVLGLDPHRLGLLFLDHDDRQFHQVANHAFDIAADVADLGELARFDLDEGRLSEFGQAPGDLGLADAGGADHDDVLRHDLVPQLRGNLLSAPAVAQRDGHGPLGALLADDEAVEFGDDLPGGEIGHGRASTAIRSLV